MPVLGAGFLMAILRYTVTPLKGDDANKNANNQEVKKMFGLIRNIYTPWN